ncbi:ABC-2 family transporter protein [Clostridium sp.]|uniref:ABC transporter permease n=1 Tax=Clostridium sp. TaxID=1506 RepID=UPI0028419D4A|nr:ABC-2 family transporter protein [Clostridium sp.]MDR3596457.1 ABC-2 family transporter protein [Clostridium sp.]
MKRNLRFILMLFKMKLSKMMVYRLSFFGGTFVDGSLFLLWLLMFNAIYSQVDSIGGWSRGQATIFLGTFSLLNAINMTIYFFGVIGIPNKIRNGELDHYLTKPINPLLRITFENINLGSAPLIFFSIGIIAYGVSMQGMVIHAGTLVLYILFIILMAILYYDMELIVRTVPFLVISASSIERLENAAFDLCMRVPGVLFKGAFKVLFYFILPYGIMATIPTQIISNSVSGIMIATSAVIVVAFTVFAQRFWRLGLQNYKSASS